MCKVGLFILINELNISENMHVYISNQVFSNAYRFDC